MFDAAIIGGGPAGCSAAIHLAAAGARVVLLEAAQYPHDKLCGEFLSPECGILLDRLGLTSTLRALAPASIQAARITTPGGGCWTTTLPPGALGLSRRSLDAALAQRALACRVLVRDRVTVTGVSGTLQAGFELTTRAPSGAETIPARLVIAAHGKRATLDRTLGRRFVSRLHPFTALKAHFHGPPLDRRVELYTFRGGYCGLSEIEGGLTDVCLLVRDTVFRAASSAGPDHISAFLAWMAGQNERLGAWLAQAERVDPRWLAISQVPFSAKRPVVSDLIMAGDAAGLIAPLAGDGIAMALAGGELAAALSSRYLSGTLSAAGLKSAYSTAWQRQFRLRLALGRLLQALLLRPSLASAAVSLLAALPPLGRFVVTHTRDAPMRI